MAQKRLRRSEEQWREILSQWRISGLSARAFAAREGLPIATLYQVNSRLRSGSPTEERTAPRFIEIAEGKSTLRPSSSSIAIVLRDGVRLVLRGAVDVDALRTVMEVLRSC